MKKRGRKLSKCRMVFWEALPKSTQKPIGEILDSIDSLVKDTFIAIARNDGSEVEILSVAVRDLPSHMKGLAYNVAEADHEASLAKDEYELLKAKKEKAIIATDIAVAVAEREVATDDEVVFAKDTMRKAQHNYKILKVQYDANDRQFRGWQSRLSTIRKEMEGGV